jgi:hypothetical protein
MKFVNEFSSYDIMHVIQFHQINAQVKWISQILVDIEFCKNILSCVFKNICKRNEFVSSFVF